jgi:hypothetical protein
MNQAPLFPDVSDARQQAIESDIAAAGGLQDVGKELGLADCPITAGKLLSNKVQQNGRHRLSDAETWRIRQLARKVAGRSQLHELESDELDFEGGKWLTSEDIKARKKKRIRQLLAELTQLQQDDE